MSDWYLLRAQERFYEKVAEDGPGGCWLWTGARNKGGYGQFHLQLDGEGVYSMAHRAGYRMFVGPVPAGLDLDHLCRVRHCVNPRHLEPVTRSENVRRGIGPALARERAAAVTHCPQGHEYTPENTVPGTGRSGKACRSCKNAYLRRYLAGKRAERRAQKVGVQ